MMPLIHKRAYKKGLVQLQINLVYDSGIASQLSFISVSCNKYFSAGCRCLVSFHCGFACTLLPVIRKYGMYRAGYRVFINTYPRAKRTQQVIEFAVISSAG
jgi:hypothetical protein